MQELTRGGVTLFVPCLNEEGDIKKVIESLVQLMDQLSGPYEILVVDDCSTDRSVAEIESCRARHADKPIRLIKSPVWRGLGRNYFIAAKSAQLEYFILVSGDGAQSPEAIRDILALKGQADAIVPYFGFDEPRSLSRRLLSWTFTRLVNMLSGHSLRYYNGPVLHKTENVRTWTADTTGFGYQAELLAHLMDQGITIKEIQIANTVRSHGTTKAFAPKNVFYLANSLLHIGLRRLQRMVGRKP